MLCAGAVGVEAADLGFRGGVVASKVAVEPFARVSVSADESRCLVRRCWLPSSSAGRVRRSGRMGIN